ncbi:hypothetical protein LJC08_03940 [Methanimicrococcus sp. OttesenSCG-928-J09]|nr:hypothetical protein [Methanimicrococcus sp. OttesenSCG-928-J09]
MAETKSKLDSYFSKHYDEKQLVDRYRISFETLMLTFILIFMSGTIKISYGQWATDNTEMIILMAIPATYFIIRSIWKGAYFSIKEKTHTWTLAFSALICILYLATIVFSIYNGEPIIENGMLSENLFPFFIMLPFLAIIITYAIKKRVSKNEEETDE